VRYFFQGLLGHAELLARVHDSGVARVLFHPAYGITLGNLDLLGVSRHVIPHMQREAIGRFGQMFSKSS